MPSSHGPGGSAAVRAPRAEQLAIDVNRDAGVSPDPVRAVVGRRRSTAASRSDISSECEAVCVHSSDAPVYLSILWLRAKADAASSTALSALHCSSRSPPGFRKMFPATSPVLLSWRSLRCLRPVKKTEHARRSQRPSRIDFGQYIRAHGGSVGAHDATSFASIRTGARGDARQCYWNRNKRSITLDSERDAVRDTARHLIASADVVIENFRPSWDTPGADRRVLRRPFASSTARAALRDDCVAQVKAWKVWWGRARRLSRDHVTKSPVYTVYSCSATQRSREVTVPCAECARAFRLGQRVEIPSSMHLHSVGARG